MRVTDQCAAMAKAIRIVLPNTRRRRCRWHVLKNGKGKLGKVNSKYRGFKGEFNDLITDEIDKTKFERRWSALIKKYRMTKKNT